MGLAIIIATSVMAIIVIVAVITTCMTMIMTIVVHYEDSRHPCRHRHQNHHYRRHGHHLALATDFIAIVALAQAAAKIIAARSAMTETSAAVETIADSVDSNNKNDHKNNNGMQRPKLGSSASAATEPEWQDVAWAPSESGPSDGGYQQKQIKTCPILCPQEQMWVRHGTCKAHGTP